MTKIEITKFHTQWGNIRLAQYDKKLCLIMFPTKRNHFEICLRKMGLDGTIVSRPSNFFPFAHELELYFAGQLTHFSSPFTLSMTSFQEKTLHFVEKIPFGHVLSYGAIAQHIGHPNAARAIGNTNNVNPLPLRIPCHRVIAANQKLGGFGGGLPIKIDLLTLEGWRISNKTLKRARL